MHAYRGLLHEAPEGGHVIEVGCWLGKSLCSAAQVLLERQLQVTAVDAFYGPDTTSLETTFAHQLAFMGLEERCRVQFNSKPKVLYSAAALARENFARFGLSVVLEVGPSVKMAEKHGTATADFIFIDADHTRLVEDVHAWWRVLKPTGVMAGHDYQVSGGSGFYRALREQLWSVFPRERVVKPHGRACIWAVTKAAGDPLPGRKHRADLHPHPDALDVRIAHGGNSGALGIQAHNRIKS